MNDKRANAIYRAGCILGLASTIDREALADVVANPQPSFVYGEECQLVLELLRKLDKRPAP